MFIGYFTERPYQDQKSGYFGATGRDLTDLSMSNRDYDPKLGAELYNRYLDEKVFAEEMGFDGLMLNEHHSTPFCMGGVMNVEASILARITNRAKIVLLGNVLPIWEDPLWLAEELAEIDMISGGLETFEYNDDDNVRQYIKHHCWNSRKGYSDSELFQPGNIPYLDKNF